MARDKSDAPWRMMASMSLGVMTMGRPPVCRLSASITVGTPTAITGTPSVCWVRGAAFWGTSPAVDSCTLHPRRRASEVHRLSTHSTAAGRICWIMLRSSSAVAMPCLLYTSRRV